MSSMHTLSDVAPHFCRLAGEVISDWKFQRRLIKHWSDNDVLRSPRLNRFFTRVNDVLIDRWFLSVARLHDPASSGRESNISLNYIVEHSDLDAETRSELRVLLDQMTAFARTVKAPRSKFLAHNDMASLLSSDSMGAFQQGEDEAYIAHLHRFVSIVSKRFCGMPFLYDDLIANDVDQVMNVLAHGLSVLQESRSGIA